MVEQINASHILLMYAGSERSSATRSKEDARSQIAAIEKRLQEGADFAALAREHSDCGSALGGGDLGGFGRGQMVKGFEDAAFALNVGDTSGIIETPFGFHIIHRTA
ncbi:MAG: peptidylprolyl isomerase [Polyangiales bacterium]